jgi:hypothetical protein
MNLTMTRILDMNNNINLNMTMNMNMDENMDMGEDCAFACHYLFNIFVLLMYV